MRLQKSQSLYSFTEKTTIEGFKHYGKNLVIQ